jgi:hypothetical protein
MPDHLPAAAVLNSSAALLSDTAAILADLLTFIIMVLCLLICLQMTGLVAPGLTAESVHHGVPWISTYTSP